MKKFRLAPIVLAIASVSVMLPSAVSQAAAPIAPGDLSIYTAPDPTAKAPTILFMVEGSTFTNNSDASPDHWLDVEIIGTPQKSNDDSLNNAIVKLDSSGNRLKDATNKPIYSLPVYDRNYYFESISGARYYTRLTRMKDAVYYLMDTDGKLPDNYQVGIGRYSSGTLGNENDGDGLTGSVNVLAAPLGPVANSNDPSSQRYKIKAFVANMCANDRLCTGNAPMASAYAEAGAYMMGTKTAQLTSDADPYIRQRVLRVKNSKWQYCPPASRVPLTYVQGTGSSATTQQRLECISTGWVNIDGNTIAPYWWANTLKSPSVPSQSRAPTQSDINTINAANQNIYDLLWRPVTGQPYGISNDSSWSPVTLSWTNYDYGKDTFSNDTPTTTATNGTDNGYDYYYDKNLEPSSSLVPDFHYRKLRKKYFVLDQKDASGNVVFQGGKEYWQYCPLDKSQLVDYIYSSYRYMCQDADWVPLYTTAQMTANGFRQNPLWLLGNRPKGVDIADGNDYFIYDGLRNPYDGWDYYYDVKYTEVPALPKTLSNGYSTSGIRNSPPEVRSTRGYTYQKPSYSTCSASVQYDSAGNSTNQSVPNSIFFLTAAWPQSVIMRPTNEMNMSLTSPATTNTPNPMGGALTSTSWNGNGMNEGGVVNASNNLWGTIGEYSKRLNSTNNPAGVPIKTGVFSFVSNGQKLPVKGAVNGVTTYDCTAGTNISLQNACKLGQFGEGFGEGGFFQSSAQQFNTKNASYIDDSYKALADAMGKMVVSQNATLGLVPSSTPTVPSDPITPNNLLTAGYLPLVAPTPSSGTAQWQGNLRKYNQSGNTFVDSQSPPQSPFTSASNALLSSTSLDLWSSKTAPYKSPSLAGGAYEKVPTPATGATDTPRNVYISTPTIAVTVPDTGTPGVALTRVKPMVDNNDAGAINKVTVAGVDNQDTLRTLLLNYMGFNLPSFVSTTTGVTGTTTDNITATANSTQYLGGVNHSTPIAIVPSATYSSTSHTYTPDSRYIVFGAMDNALHIVDDSTGKEVMSYFPQEVLAGLGGQQYKGITPNLTVTNGPAIGVDAPWTAYSTYSTTSSKMTADKLYLYGGARLGAQAYYGLNLTGLSVDAANAIATAPKQLFTITPTTQVDGKSIFNRLGYTFAKPVIAKIKWQGKPKVVAILSGGYDRKYDAIDANVTNPASVSSGNAIYIVDAENGQPLIVASDTMADTGLSLTANSDNAMVNNCTDASQCSGYNSATSTIPVLNSKLKYSIAGSVKTLDRDADDLVDAVYFSDLNGQVFRLDINNSTSTTTISGTATNPTTTSTKPAVRLVQLANLNTDTTKQGPRFYEAPIVTVHQKDDGTRFVAVSLASGDRSNPNPSPSTADTTTNYVYVVYDKDEGNSGLFGSSYTLKTTGITIDSTNFPTSPTSATSDFTKNGWRSPLNTANVYANATATTTTAQSNVTGLKAFGPLAAINNRLYVSVFNPNDGKTDTTGCTSQVVGTSEANQYCLPYGYCTTGTGTQTERVKIGKGIQAITFANGTTAGVLGRSLVTSNAPTTAATATTPATSTLVDLNGAATFNDGGDLLAKLRPMGWFDTQLSRGTNTGQATQ